MHPKDWLLSTTPFPGSQSRLPQQPHRPPAPGPGWSRSQSPGPSRPQLLPEEQSHLETSREKAVGHAPSTHNSNTGYLEAKGRVEVLQDHAHLGPAGCVSLRCLSHPRQGGLRPLSPARQKALISNLIPPQPQASQRPPQKSVAQDCLGLRESVRELCPRLHLNVCDEKRETGPNSN